MLKSPYYHPLQEKVQLSTAALDSPSVISQLVSPPQASHAGTSAESENSSYNFNDASTVLDDNGSLGSFLDATIARSRQIENTEIPNENTVTPVNSPESVEHSSDDFDEDYVELDDDFMDKCNATSYMKDIVSNKRKIPNEEISTMFANYSFNGKVPKKLGDPDKLIPTDISLQMADKSTAVPVGICEDVPVQVANNCLILTDFIVLEMPEDDNMSIILGRPFLNTAGAVIDCNKGKVTFNVDDKEHTVYFPKRIDQFNNKHYQPSVAFRIYGNPITMKLKDFCTALDIAPVGTAKKIENNPKALLELYRDITNDDSRTIQRGKIRNIELPAIRYFAYYLATSILGRENTSNISSYHLAFLVAALIGETPYHLGALVARRLSNKGPIFGGIVASRILAYLDLPLDPTDVKLTPIRLDIAAMKSHQFVTTDSSLDNIVYRMLFTDVDEREIPLPQPELFDIHRKPWSRSKEEVDEQLKIHGFHQQHDSEDAEPSCTPSRILVRLPAHTQNRIRLRHTTEVPLHGHHGIDLHLGQKPKLGGRYAGITHSSHITIAGYLYILV
ncbi:hypothetical protein QYE76_019180 [Lolium multiflorum]|uniref:Arabidopsis retrotransposon Orf1 C-terminal domain-containing protein n=1 Tax=Lolium multiflorum TaxID=4521 RepID=A0AAD8R6H5_LOLMU|nr:hypothetical protein QYE76_019180 [Lolium multiflorum]